MSGTKHDSGKIRMELLSVPALRAISEVLTFGAQKYAAHNWRKGFEWSRLYGAALRHLTAHMAGEDIDPESGLSHLAHLGCCVMFLLEHEMEKLGVDDRYRRRQQRETVGGVDIQELRDFAITQSYAEFRARELDKAIAAYKQESPLQVRGGIKK